MTNKPDERQWRPLAEIPRTGLLTLMFSDGHARLCDIDGDHIIPREGFRPVTADVKPTGWCQPVRHELKATT